MRGLLLQVVTMLQLARLTGALAIVGNAWFVVLWARASASAGIAGEPAPALTQGLDGPLWQPLLAATMLSMGLYCFGAALNDILDLRRDRLLAADRPLPSGTLSVETAVWISVLTCAASVLGATWFGSRAVVLTVLCHVAILVYHAAARFVPALGVLVLGGVHAVHMLIPTAALPFLWPVWFVMTHAMAVAVLVHVVGRKAPPISPRAAAGIALGWLAMSIALFAAPIHAIPGAARESLGDKWLGLLGVLVAAILCWIWCARTLTRYGRSSRAADKLARHGVAWMPLYGTIWLAADGGLAPAVLLGCVAVAASLGVALARELVGLINEPVGYRR